nr:hypothetical protein [Clostridia bacterium]
MDNEQSLNIRNGEKKGGISLAEILHVLRSHILLILIITLLFAAGGFLYARNKKPVYTASVPVLFSVQVSADGEFDRVSSVNYMRKYMNTAAGICEKGIVLDRANVYYYFYQERYKKNGKTIDEFMTDIKSVYNQSVKENREEIPGFEVNETLLNKYRNKWFNQNNIVVGYTASESDEELVIKFSLSVKDANATVAREMAYIYTIASDFSLNYVLNFSDASTVITTAGLINLVRDSRGIGVSSNASTKKPIIIAAVLGLVISLAVIYVIYVIDNTVKSKEQLEALSGANVIAYIEDVAEVK